MEGLTLLAAVEALALTLGLVRTLASVVLGGVADATAIVITTATSISTAIGAITEAIGTAVMLADILWAEARVICDECQ